MVKCFIQLNLPKHYITLNIILILNSVHEILSSIMEFGNSMKNPFTLPLLMFIGQSLVYFFYFFQKNYYLNIIERYSNDKTSNNKKENSFSKQSIGLILLCSFTELISKIKYYQYFYNDSMKKYFSVLKYPIGFISFFPFFLINENYFLKIKIFRHQILGLGIGFIYILISLIRYFINNKISKFTFLLIIILIESKFIETIHYIIPKKLNSVYFININLICGLKGFFGFIISLILFIIFYCFYNYGNYKLSEYFTLNNFIFSFIYCINSCILNFLIFKIIEEIKPSYYLIPCLLSQLTPLIFSINKLNDDNDNDNISFLLNADLIITIIKSIFCFSGFIFILSSIIFCEVIIFKCCNLDKFTKNEISKRTVNETINGNILIEFTN